MAPLIRACEKYNLNFFILHTGQHYSHNLDQQIFEDLNLKPPKYNLKAGSLNYNLQMAYMVKHIKEKLLKEQPKVIFVQGDTNSVLAGALAASKLKIPIAHHEAGLRSHDLSMPEEINRILTDNLSDFLFTPSESAYQNLLKEGLNLKKAWVTGNTIVDTVSQNLKISEAKTNTLDKFQLKSKQYILVTAHRAENVDNLSKFRGIIEGLNLLAEKLPYEIIYPIHPRARKNMEGFGLNPKNIKILEPQGYLDFLQLMKNSALIVTDSGGLQEEACILKIPCVTIRENTERPETIKAGINILAGTNPKDILDCTQIMLKRHHKADFSSLYGDGKAGERIIKIWLKYKDS